MIKKIFSVRNEYNDGIVFKIINIFGLKVKIRNLKQENILLKKEINTLKNSFINSIEEKIQGLKQETEKTKAIETIEKQQNKFYNQVQNLISPQETPKFSIIIPSYNRCFCINIAIESVLNQTYQNFELIIVDDGSTDGSEEFIKSKYQDEIKKAKIKYIKQENLGVCAARNTGLKNCSNEWICYLDSDNAMIDDFLETFAVYILKNKETKCFYSKFLRISEKENIISGVSFDYNLLLEGNYIDLGTFIHNKSIYEELGGFDENLTRLVDWDLIIRYTKNNTPIFVDKILLLYNHFEKIDRIDNKESFNENMQKIKDKINSAV